MRKVLSGNLQLIVLILVVVQFGLLGLLWQHQKNTNRSIRAELSTQQQNIDSANSGVGYQPVTAAPSENKVYLPRVGISLPLTPVSLALVYSADTAYVPGSYSEAKGALDEVRISDVNTAGAPQTQNQFDCSSLVRIKFETKPNPYNPNESPAGSVVLANGKTIQIYANHLKNCQKEYSLTGANPDAIADVLKQAESY